MSSKEIFAKSKADQLRGFTLIELLVVIAIIAILAAILFPVFASVRAKARATACLSNEKQLSMGIIQYQQDYDDTMPQASYWSGSSGIVDLSLPAPTVSGGVVTDNYKWQDAIFPYVKSEQVYDCQEAKDPWSNGVSPLYKYRTWSNYGSYAINFAYCNFSPYANSLGYSYYRVHNPTGLSLSQMEVPASTVLLTDGDGAFYAGPANETDTCNINQTSAPNFFSCKYSDPLNTGRAIPARHNGLTNAVYCDGHVHAVPLTVLMATKNEPYDKWGNRVDVYTAFTVEDD